MMNISWINTVNHRF